MRMTDWLPACWLPVCAGAAMLAATLGHGAMAQGYAVETRLDVPYVEHDGVKLTGNLYLPKGLDKAPILIAAHGGGFLPSYADRSDHVCLVNPGGCNPNVKLKKQPTEYLRQIYFDSLVFTPEALRHLAAQVGVSQIVLGSDYPFPWQLQPVDHIFASTSFSDDEKADMLGRTAEKLLSFGA